MPYRINQKGIDYEEAGDLTDLQQKALRYLRSRPKEFIYSAEVAEHYHYPNGQYFRGVLYSLVRLGLVDE